VNSDAPRLLPAASLHLAGVHTRSHVEAEAA
jgi:hypothetical protein